MSISISILIIEDEPAIARNIAQAMEAKSYIVSGIAYDRLEAQNKLAQGNNDLVLLDINLGGNMDGILIGQLIAEKYRIPFIYVTSYADDSTLEAAKITYPWGYIVKPFDEKDLYAAIEIAWHNAQNKRDESLLSREKINRKIIQPLTKKEYSILRDLMSAKTYAQIAQDHFISKNTVNSHIKSIYTKLGVRNKIGALQVCKI